MKKSFKLLLGISLVLALMVAGAFTVFATEDQPYCEHNDYYYESSSDQYYCYNCGAYVDDIGCSHGSTYYDDYYGYTKCYDCNKFLSCDHNQAHYEDYRGEFWCQGCQRYVSEINCAHEEKHYSSHYSCLVCNRCGAQLLDEDLSEYKKQTAIILAIGVLLAPWALLISIITLIITAIILFIIGFIIVILTPVIILVGVPFALSSGVLLVI